MTNFIIFILPFLGLFFLSWFVKTQIRKPWSNALIICLLVSAFVPFISLFSLLLALGTITADFEKYGKWNVLKDTKFNKFLFK